MDIQCFIYHSSADEHLAVMSSAAANILVQAFMWTHILNSLRRYLEVELLNRTVTTCLTL